MIDFVKEYCVQYCIMIYLIAFKLTHSLSKKKIFLARKHMKKLAFLRVLELPQKIKNEKNLKRNEKKYCSDQETMKDCHRGQFRMRKVCLLLF